MGSPAYNRCSDGATVGLAEGDSDGGRGWLFDCVVGGDLLGLPEGGALGLKVDSVGSMDGDLEGVSLGEILGMSVGGALGGFEGVSEGD